MTSIPGRSINQITYEEPEAKSPPVLLVGPIAWVRKNLFGSVLDSILTIVGTLVVVTVTTTFVSWAVSSANWFVVTFNLRQFLVGRFEPAAEWRVQLLVLIVAFVMGWALAAWARVSRSVWMVAAILISLMFIIPRVIEATVPISPAYVTAGQSPIVSGSVTQTPLEQLGFIGQAGEIITLRLATEFSESDRALTGMFSFSDPAANTLGNAAANRLSTEARIPEIVRLLAGESITANQRTRLESELAGLTVAPPVTETYNLNAFPATIRILDGATLEPLVSANLSTDSEPLIFALPYDGWYVLEKIVETPDAAALISADGIYPVLERSFTRSATTDAEGQIIAAGRVNQYLRMTDSFLVEGGRPRIDGTDVAINTIIENQYRGQRPLADYLSLFFGPFLARLSVGVALVALALIVGYFLARFADMNFSPDERPRKISRRVILWMFIALPPVIFILVAGFGILPRTSPPLWGGLLLTMLLTMTGIVVSFPIGILLALGRRSHLPVVKATCILYIELVRGVPLITVLVMGLLLVPFFAPWLGGPDTAPYRAMVAVTLFSAAYLAENVRGGLQSLPPGQEEAAKALGLSGWQVILFITLPQALRAVIPALVGQFISLFKDTSLVAIVGLIDLTGVAQAVVAQTEFIGLRREVFVFISIVYFGFSYVMSIISRRIEASGSGMARQI